MFAVYSHPSRYRLCSSGLEIKGIAVLSGEFVLTDIWWIESGNFQLKVIYDLRHLCLALSSSDELGTDSYNRQLCLSKLRREYYSSTALLASLSLATRRARATR